MSKKLTYEYVKSKFEENGFALISTDYINSQSKLTALCPRNHVVSISYGHFSSGKRCKECMKIKLREIKKMPFNEIKYNIESVDGYMVLTKDIVNTRQAILIKCPNNHEYEVFYGNFIKGQRCAKCQGLGKKDGEYIIEEFKKAGYSPLFEPKYYQNARQKLPYLCQSHMEYGELHISYGDLSAGKRCAHCWRDKLKGSSHWNWMGGKTKIHEYLRHNIGQWKKESMRQANYVCDVTGQRFDVIHHLYNFNKIVDEVFYELDIKLKENIYEYSEDELNLIKDKNLQLHYQYGLGVCLTEDIHKEFHRIYGQNDNNQEQYEEFKKHVQNTVYAHSY